ncbi:hypothetical protein FF38_03038 [Lucilia cuprina]|uniref:Uncharacterized protein n=1 Tax=Lucilia cuprina TaxID=7375 RepID=A0A0L0CBU0_LUCCU|nr:hypothetical protein FF38_03038 [Lucilia cuprina]
MYKLLKGNNKKYNKKNIVHNIYCSIVKVFITSNLNEIYTFQQRIFFLNYDQDFYYIGQQYGYPSVFKF